jgi:CIC family chloride channel protein
MTGNYNQMLALLISCFSAYLVAETFRNLPIYEALLERDLLRGGLRPTYTEPIVVEMTVEAGAPFLGRTVKELALPAGCILVRCHHEEREWIPTANTRLEEQMRITAVIAPEAADALAILRRGCEAAGR